MRIGFRFYLAIDVIQIGHWVFALLRRFTLEHGTRVLLVTHDLVLTACCDRTIQVIDGMVTK
jgi:predicted ABC-type transport system involved in lysophospholipase L1 biosynthesis ATPase subunit